MGRPVRLFLVAFVIVALAASSAHAFDVEGDAASSASTATINDPTTTVAASPVLSAAAATAVLIDPTAGPSHANAVNGLPTDAALVAAPAAEPADPADHAAAAASPGFPPEEYQPTNPEAAAAFPDVRVITAESLLAGDLSGQSVLDPADIAEVAAQAAGPTRRCGITNPPRSQQRAMQRDLVKRLRQRQSQITAAAVTAPDIGTWVHIVRRGDRIADGNIPDSWVTAQVKVLNDAYTGRFNFTLLGITKTLNTNWNPITASSTRDTEMRRTLRRGTMATLNVFVTNINNGILGYAYFPGGDAATEGVVLRYDTLPSAGATTGPYTLGDTATHEVGHWLGLYHTFNEGSAKNTCGGSGDLVADTPMEASEAYGCPSGRDTCPSVAGLDPITNYMDYTDDSCMDRFSEGQYARMLDQWNAYRAPFYTPPPPPPTPPGPPPPPPRPAYVRVADTDYPGFNLPGLPDGCNANVTTEAACATQCAATSGCRVFTFKAQGTAGGCAGGCWLKSRRGSVVGGDGTGRQVAKLAAEGWSSGILTAPTTTNAPITYTSETRIEYVGSDLPGLTNGCTLTAPDAQGCAALCAATAGCNAFSFTAARVGCVGGCWLKYGRNSGRTSRTSAESWTSGVLSGTPILTASVSYYMSSISRSSTAGCTSVLSQPLCSGASIARPELAASAAGTQQQWFLQLVSGSVDTYYIRAQARSTCTRFLSYSTCSGTNGVAFATSATTSSSTTQQFQLVPMGDPQLQQFALRAVSRAQGACASWASVQECVGGINLVETAASVVNTNNQVWRVWRV